MPARKSPFRAKGVLPLFAVLISGGVYLNLTLDKWVETWVEKKASLAYGASIDIDEVKIDLLKGKAKLKKIQITNPSAPLTNLFEIDTVEIKFSFKELLKKKWVIHSVNVAGVSSATPRLSAGLIEDLVSESQDHPVLWDKTDTGIFASLRNEVKQGPLKYLSQITTGAYTLSKMPNLKKTLVSLKHLEALVQGFETKHRDWTHKLGLLPGPTQLNAWQVDVASWGQRPREIASTLELEKRKELAIKIRENHETISQELSSAIKEVSSVKTQMDGINSFLNEDIEALKKELNLPSSGTGDLSFSLFGIHAITLLEKLSYWSDTFRHHGTVTFATPQLEIVKLTHSKQVEYHFLNKKTYPSFFIGELRVNSSLSPLDGKTLTGELTNFTLYPHFYHFACEGSLQGSIPGLSWEGLKLQATLSTQDNLPLEKITFSVDSFPIENFVIRGTSDFEVKILSGTARLEIDTSFKGPTLEAKGSFESIGTKFSVKSQFSPFEEILDSLTRSRTLLLAKASAQGEKTKLGLTIESDFGKQMAKSIQETFNKQLAQIDETLKTHILDSLFPLRQSINEKLQDAENISLAQMRTTLNELEAMMVYTKKYDPQAERFKDRYSQATKNKESL